MDCGGEFVALGNPCGLDRAVIRRRVERQRAAGERDGVRSLDVERESCGRQHGVLRVWRARRGGRAALFAACAVAGC